MYDQRIQEAIEIAEQGRDEDAIRLLNECLSDALNPNTRLMAAGIAFEIMLKGGGGEQAVIAGKSPLQNQIQEYAKIIVESYDQADEHVKDMVEQTGVYMPNIKRIAENRIDMMQLVMRAKQLSYEGNQKTALELLDNVIAVSTDIRDLLFAAGLATGILEVHGAQLYGTQEALDTNILKYAKMVLKCFDAADQASRQDFQNMGVDVDVLRNAVSDIEKSKCAKKAGMDINAARQRLASLGIEFDGSRVVVHCQKRGWARLMANEVCKILKRCDSYTVLVQNLPYFCGPNWREMSGGKPLALECQSIDEIVELLETAIAARMVDGVLPVV